MNQLLTVLIYTFSLMLLKGEGSVLISDFIHWCIYTLNILRNILGMNT